MAENSDKIRYKTLGSTGKRVSVCGFGCYRIGEGMNEQRRALELALLNGINLLDTSANYSDGGSEKLIGQVLKKLFSEEKITREDITVVTKGGYLQGENLKLAAEREKSGNPFMEIVKCNPELWHCIHPGFLQSQISLSLQRLNLKKIDVYLLHNPEYFLTYSQINNEVERKEEYYRRIKQAFIYLEEEAARGRISFYGISSNTFGENSSKHDFTSFERVLDIAREISGSNHFSVIQLPLNIFERGAVTNKNQLNNSKTVLEYAYENNIGVLVNRPLNSIVDNRIRRLVDFKITEDRNENEIKDMIIDLDVQEEKLRHYVSEAALTESEKKSMFDCLTLAQILTQYYDRFESPNHFLEIKGYYLVPRANYAISTLVSYRRDDEELISKIRRYAVTTNILLNSIESELARKHNGQNKILHDEMNKYLDDEAKSLTLSQKSVLLINSLEEVTCTLVGMRKVEYVDDVLGSFAVPVPGNAYQYWNAVRSDQQSVPR